MIKNRNFLFDKLIPCSLLLDSRLKIAITKKHQACRHDEHTNKGRKETLLSLFTQLFTPRE
jgi:hypothetical protein